MDKFVVRESTWKTKTYNSAVLQSKTRFSLNNRTIKTIKKTDKTKPLKELQFTSNNTDKEVIKIDRRISMLLMPSDQPLFEVLSDSGLSCSSNSSDSNQFQTLKQSQFVDNENSQPSPSNNIENKITNEHSEHGTKTKSIHTFTTNGASGFPTPVSSIIVDDCRSVISNIDLNSKPINAPISITPKNKSIMTRIQRDVNSPSATVRMRALNALKNPIMSPYSHFDVSLREQSLYIPDEPPTAMTDIMKGVVAYVDVRSGEDNRTDGIKKVILSLGAKVMGKVTINTTHVIFKDGTLAAYKAAKRFNIPIVSVLWVEACKKFRKICDPTEFPISDLDRFDNPELYEKRKRIKSMQPDSEIHKRLRAVTSKDSTPRRNSPKNLKKTPSAISTPTTTKKQTDLTRFLSKFDNKTPNNVVLTTDVSQDLPNSKLVDKFSELISYSSEEGFLRRKELDVLKSVTHEEAIKDTISHLETAEENENVLTTNISSAVKRTYIQEDSNLVDNVKQFSSQYNNLNISRTPRRSAIMALQNISLMSLEQSISSTSRGNNRTKIIAKEMDISAMQEENTPKSQKKVKRRTSCTAKDLDISVASPKIKKRRTLYTPRLTSIESEQVDTTNIDLMTSTPTQDKNRESSKSSQSDSTPQTSKTLVKRMLTPFASSTLIFQSSQSDFSEPMSTVENVGTLTRNESHTSFLSTKSEVSNDHLDTTISDELKTPVQEKFNNTNGNLLIDEHANVFSSSRQPGNRLSVNKTLMDIVSQRVQNINKSARRSLLPPTIHSELEMHRKFLNSEMLSQCTPKEPLTVTVKTTTLNCDSCDIPSEVYSTEQVLQEDRNATATPPVAIKKRKLFMPNESPLPQSNDNKHTSNINTNKRRKTILPTVQKQPSPSAAPPSSPPPRPPPISVITPLTTFANNKMTDSKNANSADANQDDIFLNKKAAESFSKALEIKAQNAKSDKQKTINIYKKAKLSSVRGKKKASHIVCTNMHSKEVESTREAIKKLGCFQLEKRVTNETTHIITTDPKRTLNLLRGLVRGLWILKYDWINESLNAGKWLYEEPFEIHEFSRAIKICRAERQAFGKKYRSELFSELEPFFVSSECHNISKDDLEELIELGGGRVVQHRKQAKYIVCDKKSNKENKIHVTYFWVLDSLTQMELRRIHPYSPKGCELELVAPQEMPKSYDDSKSVHYNPNINPRNV